MFAALAQTTATTSYVTGTDVLVAGVAVITVIALTRSRGGDGYDDAKFERFAEEACTYLYDQECVQGELIDLSPHLEKQPYAHDPQARQRVLDEMAKLGARAEAQPDEAGATLYRISNKLRDRARDKQMSQLAAAAASAAPHVNVGPGGVNVVQTGDNNKVGNLSTNVEADRRAEAIHAELVRLASDTRLRGFHQAQASSLAHAVE